MRPHRWFRFTPGFRFGTAAALTILCGICGNAQQPSSATTSPWPDPLASHAGQRITTPADFNTIRKPELLQDFAEYTYGHTPAKQIPIQAHVTSVDNAALHGTAIRKQITITVGTTPLTRELHLLLYLPAKSTHPVPVFVGLNFDGNVTTTTDPGVDPNEIWTPDPSQSGSASGTVLLGALKNNLRHRPTDTQRGSDAGKWPFEAIVQAGYAVATLYTGDIEPDFATGIGYGIRPLFFKPGQYMPDLTDWGAIGAWAWGLTRAADYLATDLAIDPHAIIATGHSRMGKAALWAAAQDQGPKQRFAMVISNESGQGGAGLSHREAGETIWHLNVAFPYWFSPSFHQFNGRAQSYPVDGHLLLSLIAPRPLFIASAQDDPLSDPQGEFESAKAASSVYRLFGLEGVAPDAAFQVSKLTGKDLRYYCRPGKHDMLLEDWQRYIAFADEHFHAASR